MNKYRMMSVSGEGVIYYHHLAFYKDKKLVAKVPANIILRLLCHFRMFVRLFRLEPRCAEMIDNRLMVFCMLHKVWVLDVDQKNMKVLFEAPEGFSDPLNFCKFGNLVYWGDYGNNSERKEVHIYRVGNSLQVEKVYSFSQGSIRHIHNIIYSGQQNCFWILTGDNDKKAGIYVTDTSFKIVKPVHTGEQNYRTVVAFPYKDGIIYATDSVETTNHIFVCTADNDYQIKTLAEINGSCIYGTECVDWYIFSTTVEPQEGRGLLNMFTYKLGRGIKSREAHVVAVNKQNLHDIRIIARYEKDLWPMKLFQYGTVLFPIGQKSNKQLVVCPMACKGYDGVTLKIKLDEQSYDRP